MSIGHATDLPATAVCWVVLLTLALTVSGHLLNSPMEMVLSEEVSHAIEAGHPVVALESTVISHGLPHPVNLETAQTVEQLLRDAGVVPATIAIIDGLPKIGLTRDQLAFIAASKNIQKASVRDLPVLCGLGCNGATTVASTMFIANKAGIRVFATGGIGGIHRGNTNDVSADLPILAQTPMVVVCAGAKIVLDLPSTLEWLETHGVPVIGWKTDSFPAFYSAESGLPVDQRVESAVELVGIARNRDELGLPNAVLVSVPLDADRALSLETMEGLLEVALREASSQRISGNELTPFLLERLASESSGQTLEANTSLLLKNADVASQIAIEFVR